MRDDFTAQMEWANEAEPSLLALENQLLLAQIVREEQHDLAMAQKKAQRDKISSDIQRVLMVTSAESL